MTKLDFAKCMAYLCAAIGKDLPENSMEVYHDLLGDLPAEVLQIAVKRVALEHPWATVPTPAEIRSAASDVLRGQVSELSAAEAWEVARRASCRIDLDVEGSLNRACAGLPSLVVEAMRAFGIPALCYGKEPMTVIRAQFMTIYEQLAARDRRQALLPAQLQQSIRAMLPNPVAGALAEIGKMPDEDQDARAVVPFRKAE